MQCERRRQQHVRDIYRRLAGAGLPRECDRRLDVAQQQVAMRQRTERSRRGAVIWAKSCCFLNLRYPCLRLAEIDQCQPQLQKCVRVVWLEGDCRFPLNPRFLQPVLQPAQKAERHAHPDVVRVALDCRQ